ncbi:hypothetical protein F0U61_10755 [Archangium violaceum]|uniref:hypothetical protein n=1 Tax=Archangium violaceum TaxID=83451 RepID=UPI002B322136|nr:hypothetical protein F0U61_10755 [Archangium violaceum]
MRNWTKQLGVAFSLVFALGGSSTALAYPPQCMDVCSCEDLCTSPCYEGTYRTTCSDYICRDYCRSSDTQASLTEEAREQQESVQQADEAVCSEQAVSAES